MSGRQCISVMPICVLGMLTLFSVSPGIASDYPAPGVFDVVGGDSEVRVLIYPAGLLGGLGHSHVISTKDIAGRFKISSDPLASSVEVTIPVESLEVDNDAVRDEEGAEFEKKVSDKDKKGTRKNMLGKKLLNSCKFSKIAVRSNAWSGELPDVLVTADFTVGGQTNSLEFPALVEVNAYEIIASGSLTVTHRQLGLKPISAGLGSLRVRDQMEIKFRIAAKRVPD